MIYFVRHGQTYDNANGNLLTGWGDTPLNEVGIKQAKDTSELLKNIKFDICFCSPLPRTRQTLAEIIKYHENLTVVYDDRLKERNYGEITGKPADICKFRRWNSNDLIPFKMESIDEMYDRVASFYDDIKEEYKDKTVLIVSHSGVGRVTNAYFNGKPNNGDYTGFKVKNAEVVKFDWRETCEK